VKRSVLVILAFATLAVAAATASYGASGSIAMNRGHFVFLWTLPSTNITSYSDTANDMTILYEQRREKENGKP
jgi:hypothetical protein